MIPLRKMLLLRRNIFNSVHQMSELNNKYVQTQRNCEEIKIPEPWGNVVGKWWGPQDKRPILAIHGWQDNCGTFDKLIPYLPSHIPVFAIDVPGHGLSSQIPPGVFYHSIDLAIYIRRIVQYFNWPKVSLLGHSLGAMSSFVYTMLYPDTVDFLICIDSLHPVTVDKNKKPEGMVKIINNFLKYDALNNRNTTPPSYTFAELEQLLHKGSQESIDLDSCKYILRRNISPSTKNPNQFYFTRDPRLKVPLLLQWTDEDLFEGSQRITCPLFLSMAKSSPFFRRKDTYMRILDIIVKHNKNMEYHELDGSHHVHLNNPEKVEGLVNAFIEKYDLEDRSSSGIKQEMRFN